MRIKILHETNYSYEVPARNVQQLLRLTPCDHDGQHVLSWRIEPSVEGRLRAGEDGLGNVVHAFAADDPVSNLTVLVRGEVETSDTAGIVRSATERVPDSYFLRPTDLTAADDGLRDFAVEAAGGEREPLARLHALLRAIHAQVRFETGGTDAQTTAAESFAAGRGVCQDLTHIFLAVARHLDVPSRYVSGYFRRADEVVQQEAGHAWAEAKVPGLGWVGFDPANGISVTDAHVRVAIGLDYLGAAPVRGSRRGGGAERLDVRLQVGSSQRQAQG